jgi:hypothetical protein
MRRRFSTFLLEVSVGLAHRPLCAIHQFLGYFCVGCVFFIIT